MRSLRSGTPQTFARFLVVFGLTFMALSAIFLLFSDFAPWMEPEASLGLGVGGLLVAVFGAYLWVRAEG